MLAVCGENLVSFTLNKPNHFGCGMVNMIAATATNGGSEPPSEPNKIKFGVLRKARIIK